MATAFSLLLLHALLSSIVGRGVVVASSSRPPVPIDIKIDGGDGHDLDRERVIAPASRTRTSHQAAATAVPVGNFVPILETTSAQHQHGHVPAVVYRSSATGLRVAFVRAPQGQSADNAGYMTLAAETTQAATSSSTNGNKTVQHVLLEPRVFMGSATNAHTELLDHLARRCLAQFGSNESYQKQRRPCYKLRVSEGIDPFCAALPMYLGRADLLTPDPSTVWVILTGTRSDPAGVLKCIQPVDAKMATRTKETPSSSGPSTSTSDEKKDPLSSRMVIITRQPRSSFFRSRKKNDRAYLSCLCG